MDVKCLLFSITITMRGNENNLLSMRIWMNKLIYSKHLNTTELLNKSLTSIYFNMYKSPVNNFEFKN